MKAETQEQIGDLLLWSDSVTQKILEEVCREHGVLPDALADLVAWERSQQEEQRSRNMNITFDEVFENNKYWG